MSNKAFESGEFPQFEQKVYSTGAVHVYDVSDPNHAKHTSFDNAHNTVLEAFGHTADEVKQNTADFVLPTEQPHEEAETHAFYDKINELQEKADAGRAKVKDHAKWQLGVDTIETKPSKAGLTADDIAYNMWLGDNKKVGPTEIKSVHQSIKDTEAEIAKERLRAFAKLEMRVKTGLAGGEEAAYYYKLLEQSESNPDTSKTANSDIADETKKPQQPGDPKTPAQSEVYDWAKDPEFMDKPESTEDEVAKAMGTRLREALESYLEAKKSGNKDVKDFARHIIEKTFSEMAVQGKWTSEEIAKRHEEISGYMSGKRIASKRSAKIVPSAEEIAFLGTTEEALGLSPEISSAIAKYLAANQEKDINGIKLSTQEIRTLFDKLATESKWSPNEKAARAGGLVAWLNGVTNGEPTNNITAVPKVPEVKKTIGKRLRDRWNAIMVAPILTGIKGEKSEDNKSNKGKWLLGAAAVAGVVAVAFLNRHNLGHLDFNPLNNKSGGKSGTDVTDLLPKGKKPTTSIVNGLPHSAGGISTVKELPHTT